MSNDEAVRLTREHHKWWNAIVLAETHEKSQTLLLKALRSDRDAIVEKEIRGVLVELVRLYDWRFELARQENEPHNKDEMKSLLRQYGEQKKAAWIEAKRLLKTPKEPTDDTP